MVLLGSIFAPQEIRRGTKNRHFERRSAFWAPKVLSGRASEKNMKNRRKLDRKMIGFGMLKPSKTMPCAMNSWLSAIQKKLENRCRNGSQKALKIRENRSMGVPWFDFLSFLWILGDVEKSMFFNVVFRRQKSIKIEPWTAKGSPKWLRLFDGAKFPGQRGPYTVKKKHRFDSKTVQKGSRHAVGPKARRIKPWF